MGVSECSRSSDIEDVGLQAAAINAVKQGSSQFSVRFTTKSHAAHADHLLRPSERYSVCSIMSQVSCDHFSSDNFSFAVIPKLSVIRSSSSTSLGALSSAPAPPRLAPMVLGGRNDRRRNPFFLTLLAAVLLLVFFTVSLPKRRDRLFILRTSEADQAASAGFQLELSSIKSKHAYATFLASDSEEDSYDSINEDKYFVATRILAYQLLHAPETRSNNSIPFVVLVNKHVSEAKRDRLRR